MKLWKRWKKTALFIANIQITIALYVIYFLVLTPLGFILNLKAFKKNKSKSYWIQSPARKQNKKWAYKQ